MTILKTLNEGTDDRYFVVINLFKTNMKRNIINIDTRGRQGDTPLPEIFNVQIISNKKSIDVNEQRFIS